MIGGGEAFGKEKSGKKEGSEEKGSKEEKVAWRLLKLIPSGKHRSQGGCFFDCVRVAGL